MMTWDELAQKLELDLHANKVDKCIERTIEEMNKLPQTPFHIITKISFSNKLSEVAKALDAFADEAGEKFAAKAFNFECSSLEDEPQSCTLQAYAYKKCGDHEEYEWLEDDIEHASESSVLTLTGLEELQSLFASGEHEKPENVAAAGFALLLALLKYQNLIHQSLFLASKVEAPLLASSCDFDLIYSSRPLETLAR